MSRRGIGTLLTVVASLLSAGAAPAEEADRISNWTAAPYWSGHEAAPSDARNARDANPSRVGSAGGRHALATGPLALPFIAVFPCRLVDTRGNGAPLTGGFLPAATVRNYTLAGLCNIPTTAQAISLNVTVVNPTGPGFLAIWPQGGTFPPVSTLNYLGNDVIVNAAVVPLSTLYTGGISVALGVSGGDVILDTNGYYEPRAEVDTFNGVTGDVTLVAGANITITPLANNFTISATGGAGGVTSVAGTNGISASPSTGAVTVTSNATSAAAINTIVARDGSGNFGAGSITLVGSLNLPNTTPFAGVIGIGGSAFLHSMGSRNTFVGTSSGNMTMTVANATDNTGVGFGALFRATTGNSNAAFGAGSLSFNTTGSSNSAVGQNALGNNTTGSANSAFGQFALQNNLAGVNNTAFGNSALQNNTVSNSSAFGTSALRFNSTGTDNSAFGFNALTTNSTGNSSSAFGKEALTSSTASSNSAFGATALKFTTTGCCNAAFGGNAMQTNVTGTFNTAIGGAALFASTGSFNTALGASALNGLTSGAGNIGIGYFAGANLASGNDNIYIGADTPGNESNVIRIGATQTATVIAGIYGAAIGGSGLAVSVNSSGRLGTTSSSRRYKEDIVDIADESDVLMLLRPVSYFYKTEYDETRTRQYGLIAEEVAELAPGLVALDKDGRIETVRYPLVNAMLLNEVQKSRRLIDELRADRAELLRRLDAIERSLSRVIDKRRN